MIKQKITGCIFTVILFIAVALTWGTTWMAMKIALTGFTPVLATGLRFLIASPILIVITKLCGQPLLFPSGQRWFQVILSVFYFAIPFSLMIYGEETVSSGVASLLFSIMPAAIVISSWVFLRQKINGVQSAGTLVVMAALGVIIINESGTQEIESWKGVVAILLAVFCHSLVYVQCRKRCSGISVLTYNALPCAGAALLLTVFGMVYEIHDNAEITFRALAAVGYLGVVAGILGILAYFQLQKRVSPFYASLVYFVFPLVAITLEGMITGHAISELSAFMIIPFLLGIFMVLSTNRKTTKTIITDN
ncbi:DMT family transporter [Serratia fonticola]|uniref:DMT family transporter n=1 Tax=Serratia fonticola TaxID=47917 RepID=UPI002DBD04AC|nr:DMT family transporter [Serratia fonticola]MEB7884040.1 DMT family transporter [Serratia fonticola]